MANNRPVKYLQTDSRWRYIPYANKGETSTIGGSGCGPTAMAMVIATWCNPKVTPVTTCSWALSHNFKATGSGTYHNYFVPQAKAYGLDCYKVNAESIQYMSVANAKKYHDEAHKAVEEGNLVICLMGKGNWTRGGHYILWYDNDGDDVLINDPASTAAKRERNKFSLLKSQVRFYWVVKVPKEVISMTNSEVKNLIKTEVASQVQAKAETIANEAIADYFRNLKKADTSSYAEEAWKKANEKKDDNGKPIMDGTMPGMFVTREQIATIMNRLGMLD